MSNGFDAYHKWLSIPPHDQPPNHYRLLGLGLFESDPDVVAAAADRQMAHVQTYKTGPHSELSQKLLNEISAAKICLLRPKKKEAYDEQLRQQLGASPQSPPPIGFPSIGTPPAGIPSTGAPRTSNPAAYANVGSDVLPARPGAASGSVAASMPHGMPYPAFSNPPVAPPPPALAPPVTDAPPRQFFGTMTILVAAGVAAVLLTIGIVMVLGHRGDRTPSSSGGEKSDASAGIESPNNGNVSPAAVQPLPAPSPPSPNPAAGTASGTGPVSPFQSGFKSAPTPATSGTAKNTGTTGTANNASPPNPTDKNSNKKPPVIPGSEVATVVSPGNHPPDKNHPDKTNAPQPDPFRTKPIITPPVKPVPDPALAGKAAVPDKAAIAAAEQRLGNSAEVSTADLLDQAHKAAEAADVYVLLRRALASAVKQGDAATAISTADEIGRRFAVNSLEVRSQTLDDLQGHALDSDSLDALAEAAATLIDEATAAAQPDLAQHLAELSLTSARKSCNVEIIRKVTLRILRMRSPPTPTPAPQVPAQ
jgi:hypothetical protein